MPKLLLVLLEKPPLLTESQVKVLIDIGVATGQLTLGVMVLPFVITGLDKTKLPVIALGLAAAAGLWLLSIFLARRIKL